MDSIILTNIGTSALIINDLGVYLEAGDSIDLNENFSDEDLIESTDLENAIDSVNTTLELNLVSVNYTQLIDFLIKLNKKQHEDLVTLTHDLYKTSFFRTTKDVNGLVSNVITFTDNSETQKIYEEEITRDNSHRVSTITRKLYNTSGILEKTEVQTLVRDISGRLENISNTIS